MVSNGKSLTETGIFLKDCVSTLKLIALWSSDDCFSLSLSGSLLMSFLSTSAACCIDSVFCDPAAW